GEGGGFSNPAIYRHYENKDALIRDVIRESYAVFKSYLFDAADVEAPRARLDATVAAALRFALDYPHDYELLFFSPHRLVIDRYPEDFRKGKSTGFRFLAELVRVCLPRARARADLATDAALTIVAHMHGLVILHQTGRFNDDPAVFKRFFGRSMRLVLAGVLGKGMH
ncbi:MAG: WHG domain-containing protein, partial [Gemmatimonadales bacterium]|nr:WHG domain-containing protein [Gemmatimonadales bacterium]